MFGIDLKKQIQTIRKFHRHLDRHGFQCQLDTAAVIWINVFAKQWRKHRERFK